MAHRTKCPRATGNTQEFEVSTTQGNGAQITSNRNPIDHTQDIIYLWLNPLVTVSPTSATTSNYALGTVIGSNGLPEPMDVIGISVQSWQNPSSINIDLFEPLLLGGVMVPGLANVCAHPLPPSQCTQANLCGCVPSDFAPILAADPLVGVSTTTPLSQLDPNRYISVSLTTLEGPTCAGCDVPGNTFTESDAAVTSQTSTETTSSTVGFTTSSGFDFFGGGISLVRSSEFTWTNSMSQGKSDGTAHTENLTVQTTSVGCREAVDIYEDTVYHTFAFALEAPPPAPCN